MITVEKLREELAKFPARALCYAYEGETCGIVIVKPGDPHTHGFIYCSEKEISEDIQTCLFD